MSISRAIWRSPSPLSERPPSAGAPAAPQDGAGVIALRPVTAADTDALLALWALCGLTRPWNDAQRDIARKLALKDDGLMAAVRDGHLVGSAMYGYDGYRGAVYYLGVHPDHRRRGVAQQLLARAAADLQAMGCPKINIVVRAENHAAAAFYRRLGLVEEERLNFGWRLTPAVQPPAATAPL